MMQNLVFAFDNEYCEGCLYFYSRSEGKFIQLRQFGEGKFVFEKCIMDESKEVGFECLDEPIANVVLDATKIDLLLKQVDSFVDEKVSDTRKITAAQAVAVTVLLTYGNYRLKKKYPHFAPGMKIKEIESTKIKIKAICNKYLINGFIPKLARTYIGIIGVGTLWYNLTFDWFKSNELKRDELIQDQLGDAFGGITEVDLGENFYEFESRLSELLLLVNIP